jgi:lysophospholipase L1-like esterase
LWTPLAVLIAAIACIGQFSATHHERLMLTDGSAAPNVAFIGDSYTLGAGVSTIDKRWTTLVSHRLGWTEHNFGFGGTGYVTTPPNKPNPNYLGVLDRVAASHPDIVVISGGQNDMSRFDHGDPAVTQAITDTFRGLRQRLPNARIIAIGPSVPGPITGSVIIFDLNVQIAAHEVAADYVSLIAPPVVLPDMVIADGVHVNATGHQAIADRIVSVLAPGT